jgi:hypothetical protein
MSRGDLARLASAAALTGLGTWLAVYPARGGPALADVVASPAFYAGITLAFAASAWAAWIVSFEAAGRSRVALAVVLSGAAAFRLMLLPAAPALSDDVYRYLWDGHVQSAGVNPYRYAPADPALDAIATWYRGRINNPELPTIYPPLTQAVFLAASLPGSSVVSMKLIMILFDLGTIAVVAAMLRLAGTAPARVVIYAWSPLAVLEVAWSGHCDPIGVFFLTGSLLLAVSGWRRLSVASAALSGSAKYAGYLALPVLGKRSAVRALMAAPVVVMAIYLPYVTAGWGVLGSLFAYAERWRFNDSAFSVILRGVERLGLAGSALTGMGILDASARWETSLLLRLTEPLSIAKVLASAVLIGFVLHVLRRGWNDPVRETLAILGAALILSPTLHPWYLLWVAPLLAIAPRLSFLWLTFAVPLFSYPMLAVRTADSDPLRWLALLEFVPFLFLLMVESARRRLWERG